MKFNTAIAAMMSLTNDIYEAGTLTVDELKTFVTLLNPFAPHVTEEIWHELGGEGFLSVAEWPKHDEAKTVDSTITIAVQVCGKTRGTIDIPNGADQAAVSEIAKADERIASFIAGKNIVKEIYVKNKIFNIIAK
jgi:leucyl-tRNA synthetase